MLELLIGRNIHSTLELLGAVVFVDQPRMSVCNWVTKLGKRLVVITTCMKGRVEVAAVQLKEGYNMRAKLRHFDVWR